MLQFDACFVINLRRRPDRLGTFFGQPQMATWPFPTPQVFEATDGKLCQMPPTWKSGDGSLGCQRSHVRLLTQAIDNGIDSVLVLEDDAHLAPDFLGRWQAFEKIAPDAWDCLMLGGQHRQGEPTRLQTGLLKCHNTQRTHAYGIRGECLTMLRDLWAAMDTGHIDHLASQWQPKWNVYAPEPFLFGQAAGRSDIRRTNDPLRYWSNGIPDGPKPPLSIPRRHSTTTINVIHVRKKKGETANGQPH